jgi:hypothetical protein
MSGVERDLVRVEETNEVFTPTNLVREILGKFDQDIFRDPTKNFLDPTCGDGQALGEALILKLENGIDFEQALSTIYGVELMIDNVDLCRERLLCGSEDPNHIAIVERNIVCYNALEYDYKFARRKMKEIKHENRERKKAERTAEHARKKAEKERIKQEKKDKEDERLKRIYGKKIPEIRLTC